MPTSRYLTRLVNLEPLDYRIVRSFAVEKGLGGNNFYNSCVRKSA